MNRSLSLMCSLMVSVTLFACGDDDGAPQRGNADEGDVCETESDCEAGLNCVPRGTAANDPMFCARGCVRRDQCEDDERCIAYCDPTDDGCTESPGHCSQVQDASWQPCGYSIVTSCGETTAGELTCITSQSDDSIGVCAQLCAVGSTDECATGEVCTPEVLGDDETGVCATREARGDECDPFSGSACADADICASLTDTTGAGNCLQRCGTSLPACAGDTTCTPFAQLGDQTLSACFASDDQDAGM